MSRIVPFESNYKTIRKFEKASFCSIVISATIVTGIWLISLIEFNQKYRDLINFIIEFLKVISYVTMLGYIGFSLISKILFSIAEKEKRKDLIDNSFDTNYTVEKSNEYYNNNDIQIGIKRLAFNTNESSFHTENTLRLMLFKMTIKYLIFLTPFLLSIFSINGQQVIRLLFEMSIPIEMTISFILAFKYFIEIKKINENFQLELLAIGNREIKDYEIPKLLIPVMEYYNVKSWASLNLDEKIFKRNNEKLSKLWIEQKSKYLNN